MIDNIQAIWDEYLKNRDNNQLKEKLLLYYIPIVRVIAGRMMISLPDSVSIDDLISNGLIGLINAIEKFDDEKGVKFSTYANIKIKGAILDGLRELDWMPRGLREKSNMLEHAIRSAEMKFGRVPTDLEVSEELKMDMESFLDLLNEVKVVSLMSLDGAVGGRTESDRVLLDVIEDNRIKTPAEESEIAELKSILVKSIKQLKENERNVIALYYYEQLTLKEIGEVLGLTESRVSQIHTKVILTLRAKIKDYVNSK
ncbi:MAG: FliA/WhiG family RNA polymerase sigma factor [Candidatus Delongbacteria bacterium]|nr:FliA/WhiG family RNA polymerase sigma factor [Candidatus Delongbacteria bacterium]MBN2834888.1 FliA/WhiG family RNA polymerase sigma factor [Candidatus Delongbacteria bacterium]